MNLTKLAGFVLTTFLTITPSFATIQAPATRDPVGMSEFVYTVEDPNLNFWRGGEKNKPLGLYHFGKNSIEFRSAYQYCPLDTKLKFAFDLMQYMQSKHLDYDSFVRSNSREDALIDQRYPKMQAVINDFNKAAPACRDFTRKWWAQNSTDFPKAWPLNSWWVNDAMLDGANLYMKSQERFPKTVSDPLERIWFDTEALTTWGYRDDQMSPF